MTDAERRASHKIPEGVKRVKPGEYTFGPAHRIVQGDDRRIGGARGRMGRSP